MELSRRGMLGGVGAALGVGAVGFAGAASVTDGDAVGNGGEPGGNAVGAGTDGAGDDGGGESGSVPVDPDTRSRRGCSATATTISGSSARATWTAFRA